MPDSGNESQVRIVAEQVADAAMVRFAARNPDYARPSREAAVPPPLKWAATIAAAILTLSASGGFIWLVSTVNEMQVTLARMDERMANQSTSQDGRFEEMSGRIGRLEAYHQESGR